jgi:hypothetical protein
MEEIQNLINQLLMLTEKLEIIYVTQVLSLEEENKLKEELLDKKNELLSHLKEYGIFAGINTYDFIDLDGLVEKHPELINYYNEIKKIERKINKLKLLIFNDKENIDYLEAKIEQTEDRIGKIVTKDMDSDQIDFFHFTEKENEIIEDSLNHYYEKYEGTKRL